MRKNLNKQSGAVFLEFAIVLPFLVFIVMLLIVVMNHTLNNLVAEQALYATGVDIQDNKSNTTCVDGAYNLNVAEAKTAAITAIQNGFQQSNVSADKILSAKVDIQPIDNTRLYVMRYTASYDSDLLPTFLTNFLFPIDVNFIVSVSGECS
ncbi:TadE family protein [Thiomicrorhabdus indica]|uniref:TadE/TadG family type IV pilus assembly protein n=1 Tax=Thiomicrorhabdus indica TaxID=2267253 RepID=UPI002AA638A5|nr:TadE family protein [Thiomicrorhabdus indica]